MRPLKNGKRIMRNRSLHPRQAITFDIRGKDHRMATARELRHHRVIVQPISANLATVGQQISMAICRWIEGYHSTGPGGHDLQSLSRHPFLQSLSSQRALQSAIEW